ncbi:LamG domain-containing protein [Haliangium ochraceum]|uniref:LamG domain-containing protein n=1 Tax=Haliangium ochraceum TaxID=80816 RepID=UPI00019B9602|nr:LamG domain-containing protein [Haliangium ochraceum]
MDASEPGPVDAAAGDAATAADASTQPTDAGAIDAPIDAAPIDAQPPRQNFALEFSGDDAVTIPNPVTGDFTIEAWIRTQTEGETSDPQYYAGRGVVQGDVLNQTVADFGVSIIGRRLAVGTGNPDKTVLSNADVTTNQWVHVAATRDRSEGELCVYVNGEGPDCTDGGTEDALQATTLYIGGTASSLDTKYFIGRIDEVRIWDRLRNGNDIRGSMNRTLSGNEPGLVGYWPFDDTSAGTTVPDISNSGNDGQLGGGGLPGQPVYVISDAPIGQ